MDVDDRGKCMRMDPSLSANPQRLHQPSRLQASTNDTARPMFAEMQMPVLPLSPG